MIGNNWGRSTGEGTNIERSNPNKKNKNIFLEFF